MKKSTCRLPSSSIAVRGALRGFAMFALIPAFATISLAADSLLPDGSLEKANSSGEWPAGWARAKNVSWESETGNFFLRLSSPAPGTHVSLYHKVVLPADVTALELSYRARVQGLVVGSERWYDARIIMNFRDASGKVTSGKPVPHHGRDTGGWQIFVHRIEVPPGSVTLEMLPSLFRVTSGAFDLDDIVLKPVAVSPSP